MSVKKQTSLKLNIIIILLIVFGLLFALITLYNNAARKTLVSEISIANQNMLELYGSQLDSLCTEVNRCLVNIGLDDYPDKISQSEISNQLSTYVLLYDDKISFIFYDFVTSSASAETASNIFYDEQNNIIDYFRSIDSETTNSTWFTPCINGSYYLMRIYRTDRACVGAWISLENALTLYKNNHFDSDAVLYFTEKSDLILASSNTIFAANATNKVENFSTSEYLQLSNPVLGGQISLNIAIPYQKILSNFNFITVMQIIIIAVFILGVCALIYYINYFLFKPIKALSDAMNSVKSGNYNVSLPVDRSSKEFALVNAAFNDMVNEINYLKVSVYEREIFNQQLELEKMQLQVKPHFYLNCLNIIFNLAQGGDFQLIQELCMAQIKYFRYMMKSSFSTVTIKEEFNHIENYLHIQKLRYPGRYDIELSLTSEAESILIPPLMLHVFAENVVKHVSSYGKVHFSISAKVNADNKVQITISDNGPGFPEDVLEKLNNGELLNSKNGEQIGISNTIKRLNLFYKGQCSIYFQNGESGGAYIYITIPNMVEETEKLSDSADPQNISHSDTIGDKK